MKANDFGIDIEKENEIQQRFLDTLKLEVNCYTEWDPLETVIVGITDLNCIPGMEPGVHSLIDYPSLYEELSVPGYRPKEAYDNARREIENLITVLKNHNVTVLRPEFIDWNKPIKSPWWEAPNMEGSSCPRDVITVIGNEIIESGMSWRSRFFEYSAYRNIIHKCLDDDPYCKWTAAPKPMLKDNAYRANYPMDYQSEERISAIKRKEFITTENDIIFEAADIMRYGKDIFIQHGFSTNLKGIEWLRRNLGKEYRVHALTFPDDVFPLHQDASLCPLRPPDGERKGVIISNPDRKLAPGLEKLFEPTWDIVLSPIPEYKKEPPRALCGEWLGMNYLHIDPHTIIVEEREKICIKAFESLGMKVIPIPFRNCYEMGGAIHCHTTDLKRTGSMVNYFPHLDKTDESD